MHRGEDKDGQGVVEEGEKRHKMQEEDILHRARAVEQMRILGVEGTENLAQVEDKGLDELSGNSLLAIPTLLSGPEKGAVIKEEKGKS